MAQFEDVSPRRGPFAKPVRRSRAAVLLSGFALPLGIWLVLTVATGTILAAASASQLGIGLPGAPVQPESGYHIELPTSASPGYFGTVANWDGQWYATIALHGYPTELPMKDGATVQNQWAFSPVYPFIARGIMEVTGLGFAMAGWLVSIVFAAVAAVAVYRLAQQYLGSSGAAAMVACLYAYPAAVVFQAAYAEGLALLLIVLSLGSLLRRRYLLVFATTLVLAFTRPVLLPLALVVGLHYWHRRRTHYRGERAFTAADRRWVVALGVWCVVMAFAWPAVAAVVTGRANAITASLAAWPAYDSAAFGGWAAELVPLSSAGVGAITVLGALIWLASRKESRLWPLEARGWPVAYCLYLLAATKPQTSIIRYGMLALLPLWPFPELSPRRGKSGRDYWLILAVLAVLGVLLQFVFIRQVWIIHAVPNAGPP